MRFPVKNQFLIACGLIAGVVAGGSSARAAGPIAPSATQPVIWHAEQAVLAGTGCRGGVAAGTTPDSWAIANGQDLSIVFTNLQVNLPGNGTVGDFAGRSQCSVRVPVEIVRGFYVGDLEQTITIGVTKSDNANLSGAATSTFFNLPVSSPSIQVPSGPGTALNFAELSATSHDALRVSAFCKSFTPGQNTIPGLYRSNVAVSAQRDSAADDAIIGADAVDVRWDIQTRWFVCP